MNYLLGELEKYKQYTVKLIEVMENEDFDAVEHLINMRQDVINKLEEISYSKEEFAKHIEALEILQLQKRLNDLMSEKKNNVRKELDKLAGNKIASKGYQQTTRNSNIYFNMKI